MDVRKIFAGNWGQTILWATIIACIAMLLFPCKGTMLASGMMVLLSLAMIIYSCID